MPDIVLGTGEEVRSISCGYQSSALVKSDGSLYVWGNLNATKNLTNMQGLTGVRQVAFTNSVCVAVLENGKVTTGEIKAFTSAVSSRFGIQTDFDGYLADKRAVQVATTNKCVAVLLENGEVVVALIEDEATVKRIFYEETQVRLQPENRHMEPIYADNVQVLGKVTALFRQF